MKDMLAMQKHQEEEQAKEAALAANAQDNKKRLLTDLAKEEAQREEQVKKLQQMKEKEKETLIASLGSGKSFKSSFPYVHIELEMGTRGMVGYHFNKLAVGQVPPWKL